MLICDSNLDKHADKPNLTINPKIHACTYKILSIYNIDLFA